MAEPTEGPTVLRILLGTQLRRLRESRGISAQEAARAIRGSESKISRIELGRNAIREIDVLDLLTYYGVGAVERDVILRKERQRRFTEGRLKLWAIVEETALRRPIGSKEILRDQLRYLLSLASRQNLTLQIVPFGMGGHAAPSGFSILRFNEQDLPDVAYLEHLTSALYFDKRADVDRYLLAMERLSIIAAKPSETPGILTTIINELEE